MRGTSISTCLEVETDRALVWNEITRTGQSPLHLLPREIPVSHHGV